MSLEVCMYFIKVFYEMTYARNILPILYAPVS